MSTSNSAINPNWLNPTLATCRQAALDILKPTAAQLEHGLELHRHATVIDNYGFAVHCPPDPAIVNEAIKANAYPEAISRESLNSILTRMATDPHQQAYFQEVWQAAGVTCVMRNAGEEGSRGDRMLERLACHTYVTDRLKGFMARATTADDIKNAKAQNQHCYMFTTNGVPLSQRGEYVAEELHFIRIFRQLGVRMMHLTYNRRNALGDGCAEPNDGGLSDLGKLAIAEMNKQGVIVDLAHSSIKTGLDAIACSSKPLMVSHATCVSVNPHCRAKSDELIKAIADNHGVMGIAAIPAFLGGSGKLDAMLDHIDHAVKIAGPDHVAIGTDVANFPPASPGDEAIEKSAPPAMLIKTENFWPANDALFDKKWKNPFMCESMAWTNWPLFTVGLVQRGHSDEAIMKILGGNALRVLASADEAQPS